jgi:hypothetical protein
VTMMVMIVNVVNENFSCILIFTIFHKSEDSKERDYFSGEKLLS